MVDKQKVFNEILKKYGVDHCYMIGRDGNTFLDFNADILEGDVVFEKYNSAMIKELRDAFFPGFDVIDEEGWDLLFATSFGNLTIDDFTRYEVI